jgi:CBS domain containing-hemolysin-like protein
MTLISLITKPFIWLLTKTNDLFLSIFGLKDQDEAPVSEEEIKAIVQESAQGGEIQEIEHNIVHRVFALGDRRVSELMTHRNDLVWFDLSDSLDTIKRKADLEKHSMYLVSHNHNIDQLASIVSVKDMLDDMLDALLGDATEYNPFFEFLHYYGIAPAEASRDYNTLGGLLLYQLNHIPVPGEKVLWHDFELEVVDMDQRRIDKVLITLKK